jgi:ABC-type branched-subunit amino acid transport system substrate-binding protein
MPFHRPRIAAAAAMALLLVGALAGCRGAGTTTTTSEAGMKTDVGVTKEPCPKAIDTSKGCIYLGTISDLTVGPFAPLAVPITKAQEAFWNRVNKSGGIGGYEIDVTKYVKDNKYNPQTHNEVYQEIKPSILALAQTLGSPTTAAIIDDLKANNIVAVPASWTSAWAFEDVILESGVNYCIESMNIVDYARTENPALKSVMAVHYAGDYGDDGAAGAKYAAEKLGLTFTDVKTDPGADKQAVSLATARPSTRRSTPARPRPRSPRCTWSRGRGRRGPRTPRATRRCAKP